MENPGKKGRISSSSSDDSKFLVKNALEELRKKFGLSDEQLLQIVKEKAESVKIPVSIFSNERLSGLELLCRYLKERIGLSFTEIANVLNRNYRTVWTTHAISSKKHPEKISVPQSRYFFPVSAVAGRNLSVLESIVTYLRDELGLRFVEIASELHRDQRNIWTVYSRAKKKLGGNVKA